METVRNMNTLKMLEKAGHIKFCNQTGATIINGVMNKYGKGFTCYYIDEAINSNRFEYRGIKYEVKYISGCFYPYVFKIN